CALSRRDQERGAGLVAGRELPAGGPGPAEAAQRATLLPDRQRRTADRRERGGPEQDPLAGPAIRRGAADRGHGLADQALFPPRDRGSWQGPDHSALPVGHRPQALRDALVRVRGLRRVAAGPVRRSGFRLARWRGYRLWR